MAPERFPPERFEKLANTSLGPDGFKPIFACHKSADGKEIACAGYVLRDGHGNLVVRLAAKDFGEVKAAAPLYPDYRAMAKANGVTRLAPKERFGR